MTANLRGAVPHFYIRIGGDLASEEMISIDSLSIESSLHAPDMATLVLRDLTPLRPGGQAYQFIDDGEGKFKNGQALTVSIKVGDHEEFNVFDGEIVEVEAQLLSHGQRLTVRGFDRMHKLARGTHTRTFRNVTDMDVVQKIGQELGFKVVTGPASIVHDYVLESNQTHLDFLRERAQALGYLLFVDGNELHCEPMKSMGSAGTLEWGVNLHDFNPRVSSIEQASQSCVRGWNWIEKRAVEGCVEDGAGHPQVKASGEEDLGKEYVGTDTVIRTEKQAEIQAKAHADQKRQKFIEATGTAGGYPKMTAGQEVEIKGVSKRYEGKYVVSAVKHEYHTDSGYTTEFTVSGMRAPDVAQTLVGAPKPKRQQGVVIGIVTNNNDPKKYGRVKVKFPWLSEKHESDWARIASIGAGSGRGINWTPEVNDEVLVAFEMGDMHHPYIIGGLWNGVDPLPEPQAELIDEGSGKVKRRVMYSRKKHKIILDDSDDKPSITVEDMNGNIIHIDSKTNKLTIKMKGDIDVQAEGRMKLSAKAGVDIDGGMGPVNVKGSMINLN